MALAYGLLYLVLEPRPGDLAVHVFRAELFGREGVTIWNGPWYGGHHPPACSVLSGPLSWLLGPRLVLVASCVACAALFEALARGHFGAERARPGALWLGLGTVTLLATSRLPFARGTAFGLAAVRVRWSPYWFAAGGCVERAGEWTTVIANRRGFMRLSTRFAPERIVDHGRRCDEG